MTTAVVYCSRCGREAHDPTPSMDPRWPLVLCSYEVKRNGKLTRTGCGRVPGTLSAEEAVTAVFAHRARLLRAAHNRGTHEGRPVRGCGACAPAIEHRKHLRDRRTAEGCDLCALAHDRAAPPRHHR